MDDAQIERLVLPMLESCGGLCLECERCPDVMIIANGERWKALRRFFLATVRDFEKGKRSVEERIQEEAQCLVEELRKSQAPGDLLDPSFLQVFELFSGFLKYFPGVHVNISKNMQEILDYIERSVQQHQENLDASNPRDFIDTYLLRMEKNTEVYPILSSALHDPQYFEQPDTFNPDRFLDANGALKKNEAFMPFSIDGNILVELSASPAEVQDVAPSAKLCQRRSLCRNVANSSGSGETLLLFVLNLA
ncbi:hypothetical protein NN561_019688 [Cricetulus griseus]